MRGYMYARMPKQRHTQTDAHAHTRTVNTTVLQCSFKIVIIVLTPAYESPGKCPEMALRRGERGEEGVLTKFQTIHLLPQGHLYQLLFFFSFFFIRTEVSSRNIKPLC